MVLFLNFLLFWVHKHIGDQISLTSLYSSFLFLDWDCREYIVNSFSSRIQTDFPLKDAWESLQELRNDVDDENANNTTNTSYVSREQAITCTKILAHYANQSPKQ
jgi:hypothetical protein